MFTRLLRIALLNALGPDIETARTQVKQTQAEHRQVNGWRLRSCKIPTAKSHAPQHRRYAGLLWNGMRQIDGEATQCTCWIQWGVTYWRVDDKVDRFEPIDQTFQLAVKRGQRTVHSSSKFDTFRLVRGPALNWMRRHPVSTVLTTTHTL